MGGSKVLVAGFFTWLFFGFNEPGTILNEISSYMVYNKTDVHKFGEYLFVE